MNHGATTWTQDQIADVTQIECRCGWLIDWHTPIAVDAFRDHIRRNRPAEPQRSSRFQRVRYLLALWIGEDW